MTISGLTGTRTQLILVRQLRSHRRGKASNNATNLWIRLRHSIFREYESVDAGISGFTHMAAMKAMVKLAAAVGDSSSLSANCSASAALCAKTLNQTLWTGTHWRAAAPWPHGDAIMSVRHHASRSRAPCLCALAHLNPNSRIRLFAGYTARAIVGTLVGARTASPKRTNSFSYQDGSTNQLRVRHNWGVLSWSADASRGAQRGRVGLRRLAVDEF